MAMVDTVLVFRNYSSDLPCFFWLFMNGLTLDHFEYLIAF